MKKTLLFSVSAAILFSAASMVSLQAKGYGMAGCGLGSMVLGADGKFKQVFAATTNGTSGNQTFAITTGTSNCVENSAAYLKHRQKVFVSVNYKSLEQEMAVGKGKKIEAFAQLLGCPSAKLASVSQKNHSKLFNEKTSQDPTLLISNVKATPELSQACRNI